ncbi:MAG: hypothetical protein KatS3mg111_0165 [Pirellulaceae bacterium]|nr:MAG: hypothetical protein KatS3mg111_0165 [Pirellulaceae bacterium]
MVRSSRTTVIKRGQPPARWTGFTLIELLLVLSMMAALAAIAAPRMTTLFERQQLSAAAYQIKLEWEETRLEAMRTGQVQVFLCEVGTGRYRVAPLLRAADYANAGEGAEVLSSAGTVVETQASGFVNPASDGSADSLSHQWDQLEDGIVFRACRVATDMRSYLTAQEAQVAVAAGTSVQQVLFYPDGSTTTAEVQLENQRGDVWAVRLRGLTGHTEIVRLQSVAEAEAK